MTGCMQAALERLDGARFLGWIDKGDAADVSVVGAQAARAALEGWESVDVVVQPMRHRRKRLLVADMDPTIIGQECIDELADYAGLKPEIAVITERAMRGELDFAAALRERVALLKGLDAAVISTCLAERIRPNPGAETLVRTMRLTAGRPSSFPAASPPSSRRSRRPSVSSGSRPMSYRSATAS